MGKQSGVTRKKEHAGFEYWKKDRCDKKRDYIQDDWV